MPLQKPRNCGAWLISAPSSGQGKTSVTAALARHFRNRGLNVRVFKTGPDFLDPMMLERASGAPVYQLDLWMVGQHAVRSLLYAAAQTADLILVEGVMGLYDGEPSSADLATCFKLPVVTVIDAGSMAQTFAAVAQGLARFKPIPYAGVIANRVASSRHAEMIASGLTTDTPLLATLARSAEGGLPERHLGLVQAGELPDIEHKLDTLAKLLEASPPPLPSPVDFESSFEPPPPQLLANIRIGVARDAAFAFLYRANLDLLADMGARLQFFSILNDERLPDCDALYLPGGYPELHAATLEENESMRQEIQAFHAAGKPVYAECGRSEEHTSELQSH